MLGLAIFGDFLAIFGEKMAFFLQTNVFKQFLHKLAIIWAKNVNVRCKFKSRRIGSWDGCFSQKMACFLT
jgi:hypothetical protein